MACDLVTTEEAARELGASRRTRLGYVDRGYFMPTVLGDDELLAGTGTE